MRSTRGTWDDEYLEHGPTRGTWDDEYLEHGPTRRRRPKERSKQGAIKKLEGDGLNPDERRQKKFGVNGTKIFIESVGDGVFVVKAMGKSHPARTKEEISDIVMSVIERRFYSDSDAYGPEA